MKKKTLSPRKISKESEKQIKALRRQLNETIQETVALAPYCCRNPEKDFTRNRKLPFEAVLKQVLTLQNDALQNELFQFFQSEKDAPTKSAFIQQRHKIKTEAFTFLYHTFMKGVETGSRFHGFSLYACDGSTVNLPHNPCDQNTSVCAKPGAKSYNCVHLNALFNLLDKVFVDFMIDDAAHIREKDALYAMASSIPDPEHSILTADRGYGCYNTIAFLSDLHCHFVLRVKDIDSVTSMTRQLNLPDSEFDKDIDIILTRSHKKQYRDDPKYLLVSGNSGFHYFDELGFANLKFRIVRFLLPSGEYETLVTDLPRTDFPTDMLSNIYHLRWGVETSFRGLKYDLNLVFFHSKQYDFVIQEMIARILMFNVYSLMTQAIPNRCTPGFKHVYSVNFRASIGTLRDFFLSGDSSLLDRLLYNMNPLRPDRSVPRGNLHDTKPAKPFNYRAS